MTKSSRNVRKHRLISIIAIIIAILALITAGALNKQHAFLTRGIPDKLPEPIVGGGPRLGVNVALTELDEADLDHTLSQISETGIRFIKQSFYFSDSFAWADAERVVTAVSQHNLTLIPLLDGNPDNQFEPPANITQFANWAGEFATRYGNTIDHYIIWDEPNLTSHWGNQPVNPPEYAALLTATAAKIRAADANAVIVAAPLAPTMETGPINLSEPLFLDSLYESGAATAFDVVAVKPYGFYTAPDDRTVELDTLNFSRAILIRETLLAHNDPQKAVWAGNWGWNSLPQNWAGTPSIWGNTTAAEQTAHTIAAFARATQEWPWMGIMFLENWEPAAADDDPRWGFSIAGRETAVALQTMLANVDTAVAQPGTHLASNTTPTQSYEGGWRFSPEFGADISETGENEPGDQATFTFWGTDIGVRVRRADYRARLYVTVDGKPANALPSDENGTMLILTAPDEHEDMLVTELVAENLSPGKHTLQIEASRGWDQWALNGFSVGYQPAHTGFQHGAIGAIVITVIALLVAVRANKQANWSAVSTHAQQTFNQLHDQKQLVLTAVTATIVALTGWLTWGEQAAGIYRRLGDSSQLALTAVVASIYYAAPSFFIYMAALIVLFVLIYFRPIWGVALIAACFPFYVKPLLKPILNYRFSPTEIFTLVTTSAFLLSRYTQFLIRYKENRANYLFSDIRRWWQSLQVVDYAVLLFTAVATLSLFFTTRADVANNEWRVVILEPALFYLIFRAVRPKEKEIWLILDAFVLSGFIVAAYGMWQYLTGSQLISAEGGLMRIRSFYGSPNNVGLYLGRILPLLAAMALFGTKAHKWRRWGYTAVLVLTGSVTLLTFSRGAIFLGLPAAFLYIFWQWQRRNGRRTWPWLVGAGVMGIATFFVALQIPQLAGRLDLRGQTSFFRLSLWHASINMYLDNLIIGVGLDNFLYAYRGRYILNAAWKDPDLSHPHNIFLDFATRLGTLGILAGGWMITLAARLLWRLQKNGSVQWLPVIIGFGGFWLDMILHGLVDHSFFLVDLAFAFYLMLGTAVWLSQTNPNSQI
ncbi:MAG: hypothetical protein GY943_06335 [Chloroflexi bacterium]|nr:hypothetical protein [Chloroflexota bacterium]